MHSAAQHQVPQTSLVSRAWLTRLLRWGCKGGACSLQERGVTQEEGAPLIMCHVSGQMRSYSLQQHKTLQRLG